MIAIEIKTILPTKRYLKKFVSSFADINPEYKLSLNDRFGNFIFDKLGPYSPIPEKLQEKYNDKIIISIPIFYEKKKLQDIQTNNIERINSNLEDWFYYAFFDYMDIVGTFGIRIDKSIEAFCKAKNIELDIDINFETLRKRYMRYREIGGSPIRKYIIETLNN